MNSIIPMASYFDVYLYFCLFLVLFTIVHTLILKLDDPKNLIFIQFSGFVLLVSLILYIGERPISGKYFGDTINYYRHYIAYQNGAKIPVNDRDYGWSLFMRASAQIMSVHAFFTLCAFIYIYPMYCISKEFFKEYWYYCFLMFVVSFSFWAYGVNGVRNGAAASLFLWGLRYHHKKIVMALFFFFAIQFHKTLLLPILAFIVTYFYNNTKTYLKWWLACIPLSLALGTFWVFLFTSVGFGDDRLTGYLTAETESGVFSHTGFRWDFLFHSTFGVFGGWYFIFKRDYKDKMYFQLFNTYLICNSFWILVINASYSNRFAYLSWFMMAIVIIYPLLKERFFINQHLMIGKIVFAYFAFLFLMVKLYYDR